MSSTTFAIFAVVYLAIAFAVVAMPVAAAFFTFCFGASAFKAVKA